MLKGESSCRTSAEAGSIQVVVDGKMYIRGNNQVLCYDVHSGK